MCVTIHVSRRCIRDETLKVHTSSNDSFNFEVQAFKFTGKFDQVIKKNQYYVTFNLNRNIIQAGGTFYLWIFTLLSRSAAM